MSTASRELNISASVRKSSDPQVVKNFLPAVFQFLNAPPMHSFGKATRNPERLVRLPTNVAANGQFHCQKIFLRRRAFLNLCAPALSETESSWHKQTRGGKSLSLTVKSVRSLFTKLFRVQNFPMLLIDAM